MPDEFTSHTAKGFEQRISFPLEHNLPQQFQAEDSGRCGISVENTNLADLLNQEKYLVVIGVNEGQRRIGADSGLCLAQGHGNQRLASPAGFNGNLPSTAVARTKLQVATIRSCEYRRTAAAAFAPSLSRNP